MAAKSEAAKSQSQSAAADAKNRIVNVEIIGHGHPIEVPALTTVGQIVEQVITQKDARKHILGAVVVEGAEFAPGDEQDDGKKIADLQAPINGDVKLEIVGKDHWAAIEILRHSAAHLMADAIRRLYPGTKLWVGPPIEDGFYYDVDAPETITEKDFDRIEKEMKKIAKQNAKFERKAIERAEALEKFRAEGDKYKVHLIENLGADETVSLYQHGDFVDLCRGPHVPHTGFLKHVKLMKVSGAYWPVDVNAKPLQRVYGTAFFEKEQLDEYLKMLEEAKARDHRKLGKEMDLFSFSEFAAAMPFFHPRGVALLNVLVNFSRKEHARRGYEEIMTPQIMSEDLWKTSGHAEYYADNMFSTELIGHEQVEAADEKRRRKQYVKPMNCPGCMLYYRGRQHSYAEFPLKIAEFGKVHRQEMSGVTHGLLRVKGFTQDDAHIFCRPDQLETQVLEVLDFIYYTYNVFGFTDIRLELSTRPEKYVGDLADWDLSEKTLQSALEKSGKTWKLNPGDGAFYGPKIDVHVRDCLKRSWQLGTIQVDFSLPKRFELTFVDNDGQHKQPIMVHRAIFGSIERFMGILIEQWGGQFPVWMAPVQVKVASISEKHVEYARRLVAELDAMGLRAEADVRNERIGKKIAEAATTEKVPYLLVVGDEEMAANTVAVRVRGTGKDADKGTMPFADFKAQIAAEAAVPHAPISS